MKEICKFVIDKNYCSNCREDEDCPQKYSVNGNCLYIEKDLVKEQVPENFSELKELCKELKGVKFFNDNVAGVEYININDTIAFNENGLMLAMKNNFDVLVKKRTPAQMWQIIKNLIGEE